MAFAPDYVAEALGILKERADREGLKVDADGTAAVKSLLGRAIEQAQHTEGEDAFSPRHQLEFATTARLLAEEATNAARQQQNLYVNHSHIERAIAKLRELRIWPFTRG